MGIITLITDFGNKDGYAGVMKGVMLGISPQAVVVDISHQIDPQDLVQAAYLIRSSFKYFPKGSVHTVVVDPGVGTGRAVLALESAGHYFVGPDNGVLSLVKDEGGLNWLVAVDNPDLFLRPISDTFHGRDVFAPVAAHLLNGVLPGKLGSPMAPDDMVNLDYDPPGLNKSGDLVGTVIDVDRFGNLITDIDRSWFDKLAHGSRRSPLEKSVIVTIGSQQIKGLASTFMDRRTGDFLAYIGSRLFLEVAVNQGNASAQLELTKGAKVLVTFPK